DELAVGEDRHRKDDVVQVRDAAVVGVVRRKDVPGADAAGFVQLDHPLDRLVEDADERRDPGARRGEVPLGVGDRGAEVEDLVDDRAHRRLAERGEHLVGDRLERALDDLEGDRIRHAAAPTEIRRLPYGSSDARSPGWRTTVVPLVSTIAGPANAVPGSSSSPA